MTVGFHYLDLACWIFGEPDAVCVERSRVEGGLDSLVSAVFHSNGARCSIHAEWGRAVSHAQDSLSVETAQGRHEYVGDTFVGHEVTETLDRWELHARQLRDMAYAILESRPPQVTPAQVRPALRLILSIYELLQRSHEAKLC